ncbi:hypothetical protein SDC9_149067 [bioreactor metagenome]|uniref:Uncharacterized protein n=1 Tax=bioreactor metagenome TaxID=1076179 RepID=A0A645EIL1_9ZZZZ
MQNIDKKRYAPAGHTASFINTIVSLPEHFSIKDSPILLSASEHPHEVELAAIYVR